ncbi:porin [Parasalinivibrio latis]|uniref:porin n=1 Tax=Parasalinivibrio latis TaxID=2952610 RepID=UPI0030E52786
MKKTILAMAVPALLAAGTASASINLHDADGVSVSLKGASEIQYAQLLKKNADGAFRIDDGDLELNTSVEISDSLSAIADLAFEFESGDFTNDVVYVGLDGDFGTVTFGRQYLISDDAGIGKDYELGFEQFGFVTTHGSQAAKYTYDADQFYFGVSTLLTSDGVDTTDNEPTVVDGRIGARFGDLDARVYIYNGQDLSFKYDGTTAVATDVNAFDIEAEYSFDAISLAALYGQLEYKRVSDGDKYKLNVVEIAASYSMGDFTYAVGYNIVDSDVSGVDTINNYYGNVTYKLNGNAKVYAELGDADVDGIDMGYVVGMEVAF